MRAVLIAGMLISCTHMFAQETVSSWFPLEVGNQWLYEHEVRTGSSAKPQIWRWQTVETVAGRLTIPEGTVVLRRVDVTGETGGGWPSTVFGESHYLIRENCLYFLDSQSWNEEQQRLRPEYRKRLLAGDTEPQFCFPLMVGKSYGKDLRPGWVASRVAGMGLRSGFTPASVSKNAFDVVVHIVYADETHLWFEKGIGITGEWDSHDGTYYEYRVRLLRFRSARAN